MTRAGWSLWREAWNLDRRWNNGAAVVAVAWLALNVGVIVGRHVG